MDVSPSLRIEDTSFDVDNPKFLDLVDFANFTPGDFGSLEDLVDHRVVSSNGEGDIGSHGWQSYGTYNDNIQQTQLPPLYRESENSSDKMWGGGGGGGGTATVHIVADTGKLIKSENGEAVEAGVFYNTFCKNEPLDQPAEPEGDGLTLFSALLNEKPVDVMTSLNHRSPGSDCVSYISASGYSDSGISTSLDDNASPAHHEHIDIENMVASALDSMYTHPDEISSLDPVNGYPPSYMTPSSDGTTILEGALRGTVRRGGNGGSLPSMQKTLTVMTNMTPLPPINTAFKTESLGLPPSQPQISSTNGLYATYDYVQAPAEEYSPVDGAVKLSPVASTTSNLHEGSKSKKRKYTKRGTSDEASSKGRLLHFCHVCSKGFKDKYSVNVHLRTHTGEKPFECVQCGKCFRQKAHLAKHIQIHNSGGAGQKAPSKR